MEAVRLDKWLFAARFFKSRSLASEAVSGGKVHAGGKRVKPSHRVRLGETVEIRKGGEIYIIVVRQLSEKRGPASAARLMYEETAHSIAQRETRRARARATGLSMPSPSRRPNKQERRKIVRFTRKGG